MTNGERHAHDSTFGFSKFGLLIGRCFYGFVERKRRKIKRKYKRRKYSTNILYNFIKYFFNANMRTISRLVLLFWCYTIRK
uniref:Uncharacterized protein n=1 Tax=Octopus bimaculoides TaxID=37653 RepID=A0A0L8HVA4_OCTBM